MRALQRRMQQQHFVSYTSELVGHGLNSSTSSCGDGSQYWQEDGSARSWCRIDALNRFLEALATSQDPDGGVGGTSSWHHGGGASTTLWPLPLVLPRDAVGHLLRLIRAHTPLAKVVL